MTWRDYLDVHPACEMFPKMQGEELRALGEDIKKNRLQERVKLIRAGERYAVLDGRSRLDAIEAVELAIQIFVGKVPNPTFFEVVDLNALGITAVAYVISANVRRRHLSAEDKAQLMAELVKSDPTRSDRQIAREVDASPTTAGKVRSSLEAKGDVSTVDTRTDAKGRRQPAHKPRGKKRKRTPTGRPTRDVDRQESSPEGAPATSSQAATPLEPETQPAPQIDGAPSIAPAAPAPLSDQMTTEESLWLWDTLCDFERRGVLSKDIGEILGAMTHPMLNDVRRLAPQLATWLKTVGAV